MSNTTYEHVYLLWDCKTCGKQGIPCSPDVRYCPQCGDVRTFLEFDYAYLPGDDATWEQHAHVEIPADVVQRLNAAGPSWFCVNCRADNYGDEQECHHCGAPRKASEEELRRLLDDRIFKAYMDGDRGATAALVMQFGEYAGMRAAEGLPFQIDETHEGQLGKAQQDRSAFKQEMATQSHEARPTWDAADLPSSVESLERTHGSEAQRLEKKGRVGKIVAAGSGVALLVGGGVSGTLLWGGQTEPEPGQIEELRWERHIQEQRWTQVTRQGWRSELVERAEVPPQGGGGEQAGISIKECRMAHHHYEDYVCGTKQVPCTHMQAYTETYSCTRQQSYTETYSCSRSESYSCGQNCTTTRGANGMATRSCSPRMCTRSIPDTCTRTSYRSVPDTCTRTSYRPLHSSDTVDKICQRSIEASQCSYATQEWIDSDHHVLNGKEKPARWPEGDLDALERERREERYTMTVVLKQQDETYRDSEEISGDEFERYQVGDPVTFWVSHFGDVKRWEVGAPPVEE